MSRIVDPAGRIVRRCRTRFGYRQDTPSPSKDRSVFYTPREGESSMAADITLKIEGIDGESKDSKHSSEITLQSYSMGATQPGSANLNSGLGSGKVQMQDLHCVASA